MNIETSKHRYFLSKGFGFKKRCLSFKSLLWDACKKTQLVLVFSVLELASRVTEEAPSMYLVTELSLLSGLRDAAWM